MKQAPLPPDDLAKFRDALTQFEARNHAPALEGAEDVLIRHGDNIHVLSLAAESLLAQERWGLAYQVYKRLVVLAPDAWELWNNLGRCYHEMARYEEASGCFRKALEMAPGRFSPACNLLQAALYRGDIEAMEEWAARAVKTAETPDQLRKVEQALAYVHFARRDWPAAWAAFDLSLGTKERRDKPYVGEPRWDGTPGKRVVIYGEQGLGDEILFASMYPDAMKDCEAILECDKRLAGLFRRSFGDAVAVYGTRHDKHLFWPQGAKCEARCAAGSLGRSYRRSGAFPRTPYLVADPTRRKAYRAILDGLPGRKIGIAWNGGSWGTRARERSVLLSELLKIIQLYRQGGARPLGFVSLEYRDPSAEIAAVKAETGIEVHHWKFATQTKDYDDTAALVAELDAVVSVTTTVALLAGALGKETHVLVNEHPTWHWGVDGPMPWLDLKLYRKTGPSWEPQIRQIAEAL